MSTFQITCITRDSNDPDHRIDGFGGHGFGWLTIDQLLQWIQTGHRFWVDGSTSAWIEVLRHPTSLRLYVRTIPDGIHDNNLSNLPPCPRR